jgi:hypothetical protein
MDLLPSRSQRVPHLLPDAGGVPVPGLSRPYRKRTRRATTAKCKSLVMFRLLSFVFSYLTALLELRKPALCFLTPNGFVLRISGLNMYMFYLFVPLYSPVAC